MGVKYLNDVTFVEEALSAIEKIGVEASIKRYGVLVQQIQWKICEIKVKPGDARLGQLQLALEQASYLLAKSQLAPIKEPISTVTKPRSTRRASGVTSN
jgi:hypothetical protein